MNSTLPLSKARNEIILILFMTVVCLAPFINKAFHLDDPMYIWSAKHITNNALDFYGFPVNWEGVVRPMSTVMQNPPLNAYVISFIGRFFGFGETGLHMAFLIPACAVILGTYMLAGKFCNSPLIASLAALCSPAFMVSSTNITCDVMLTAWIVWAIFWWIHGIENNSTFYLCLAAFGIIFAFMTKYFGISIVPLLLVYTISRERRIGYWIIFLIIPVVALLGYQWLTISLYGEGALTIAASYALNLKVSGGFGQKLLTLMAFTGGCFLPVILLAPLLWNRKAIIIIGSITGIYSSILVALLTWGQLMPQLVTHFTIAQFVILACSGCFILVLCCSEINNDKSSETLLLCCWIFGTLIFTGFINWTISARNILTLIPPASILVARHLERNVMRWHYLPYLLLIPSLIISLTVTWADFRLAGSAKNAAEKIGRDYPNIQFQGHWGFQYYLENLGGRAIDFENIQLQTGDMVVIPQNNSYISLLPKGKVAGFQLLEFDVFQYLTTMNSIIGAGFYSDGWGDMPFVFGKIPPEQYYVLMVK